ncbi:MAG: nucleotidyltransferase domain-containing protein [bacterium]
MNNELKERDLENIIKALKRFSQIEQAVIFGSRAKGSHKKGSDVDLAIKGKNISEKTVKHLSFTLNEEIPLPYFFDVVHYESINNPDLIEHINRVGKIIYKCPPCTNPN